ncbi:hypothetical protein SprV_0301157600 [Sparganum proliferum]
MTNSVGMQNNFYEDPHTFLATVPMADKQVVLGSLNASIGTETVLGRRKIGRDNSDDLLILRACAKHSLLWSNTSSRLPVLERATWARTRSRR